MRRRLVVALVGVALGTLLLYAGPRAFMITDMIREREALGLERTADLVAGAVDAELAADVPIDEGLLEALLGRREDLAITVRLDDGTEARVGPQAMRTQDATRRLTEGGTVTVSLSAAAVDRRVGDALVPIAAFAVAATAFAVVVALYLARRLSVPFTRLARHAELLGADELTRAPRSGVPEADDLAAALDRSQMRIVELLDAERQFSSNASHQLRTPLAALRLRLEDVATWTETPATVRDELGAAIGEVDRLADTVTDLLELARAGGIGATGSLDLHRSAAEATERWQERFVAAGRRIVMESTGDDSWAPASGRAVRHVLDILLENALTHGSGVVDVSVQHDDDHVVVRVADEGGFPRSLGEQAFQRSARSSTSSGSGIGLDLARRIAESSGARLLLVSHDPTVLELQVPRPPTSDA